jgi:hypothetical protein
MIRKFLIVLLLAINFSIFPAFATEKVIIDKVSQSEAEQLELSIPVDTPPGKGVVYIDIINPDGSIAGHANAEYCKDLDGFIHWGEPCKDFEPIATLEELELIAKRSDLPKYDPAQEPKKTNRNMIAAFAALLMLSGGSTESKKDEDEEKEKEELDFVEGGELADIERAAQRGDLSATWKHPRTEYVDALFKNWSERSSLKSPLLARKIADGSYLRAMFGSFAVSVYPLMATAGLISSATVSFQAIPPFWLLLSIVIFISTFDSFSGLTSAAFFILPIMFSGHISNRSELLTTIGICMLMMAPALIASATRPLRRLITRESFWERISDYALTTLLTGWTIKNAVSALNTLGHTQFATTYYASVIGIVASFAVALRMCLEDIAVHYYPLRLRINTPKRYKQLRNYKILSRVFKIYIFLTITGQFIGWNFKLVIGTIIFFLPEVISTYGKRVNKKFTLLHWLQPRGVSKIVVMVFVGAGFTYIIQGLFKSPRIFLSWSFALMTIPGFIFQLIKIYSKTPETDWKNSQVGRMIFRISGFLIFILITQIVRGVDLVAWLQDHI